MNLETGLKRGPFSEGQIKQLIELIPALSAGQLQWLNGYLTAISPSPEETAAGNAVKPSPGNTGREQETVWILYGTHTGNSERLAKESAKRIAALGMETKVSDMGAVKTREIKNMTKLLIIVSTDGEGDPPVQAAALHEFLLSNKCPALNQTAYSVLALGDTAYLEFCQTGKDFDAALEKAGAKRIAGRVDCDVDFEDDYERWIGDVLSNLGQLSIGHDGVLVNFPAVGEAGPATDSAFNRKNPFPATVMEKINLNGRRSSKETFHIELDLKGSGIRYEPGDALGIYAPNPVRVIEPILDLLQFSGEEIVDSHGGKKRLIDALTSDYELTPLTGLSLKHYAALTGSDRLRQIAGENAAIAEYIYGRDLYDLLKEEPFRMGPDALISILRKNTPRMYSIASSRQAVDDEAHIVVSVIRYEAHGRYKEGHCSSFLSDRVNPGDQVNIFIDPNTRFKLPADQQRPIIMIGAGTGVAPFRAFIQERDIQESKGKSWLFFGDRNFATDFLYQAEWLQYLKEGVLTRADVAFSRDQEKKVYVQDRMLEKGKELYAWLEEGACLYVCGDKQRMAKDVDAALSTIIQTHGGMTMERAAEYIRSLQQNDRYQADVY